MFREKRDLFHLYINKKRNDRLEFERWLPMIMDISLAIIKDVGRSLTGRGKKPKSMDIGLTGRKIVFANTSNNYEALKFLLQRYKDSVLVCSGGFVQKIPDALNISNFLRAIDFRKYIFIFYLAVHPSYRVRHYNLVLLFYATIGRYIELLTINKPACIFISNDHYPDSRALILASRRVGIKCIYLQHASVSSYFPPMRASHALLYGKYSEDIYSSIDGSQGVLIQVGNHKFDSYRREIESKKPTRKIGVAYNTRNDISEVISFCEFLSLHFSKESIVLRPHPGDRRSIDAEFKICSPKLVNSLDFLKGIDVLVSGSSAILLEAALMNVFPFQIYYHAVPDFLIDYYGFIKTGVAIEVNDRGKLINDISDIFEAPVFNQRLKASCFDASVASEYEFHVEDHIVSVVDAILGQ